MSSSTFVPPPASGRTVIRRHGTAPRRPAAQDIRPAATASLSRFRAWTAALAALAVLALPAPPAQAQMVSQDLVRNMSQAVSDNFGFLADVAQAFTTGGHAAGYRLTSVSLRMWSTDTTAPVYTVTIRVDNSGVPGASLGTLTNPSALAGSSSIHVFTASGGGIDLAANTTYWMEQASTVGTLNTNRAHTRSNAEDDGAAAGWSIANNALVRQRSLGEAWSSSTHSGDRKVMMIIDGYPIPAGPSINRVGVVSAPSRDADGDGHFDTYIQGDRIDVDVQFTEPVEITGDGDGVRLRLDLGADDTDLVNSRKTLKNPSVIHGGLVLRFSYTVEATDTDADGVWVQTASGDRAVFLAGTTPPTVTSADTGIDAILTATGLPVTGDGDRKVDGSVTSVPGPRLQSASVDADTLTLTFNEALDTSVDTAKLAFMLSVKHAGDFDRGSPSRYQHPTAIAVTNETTGGTTRGKVTLTLAVPAHAGDEVYVSYQRMGTLPLVLKDTSNNFAPTFWQEAVTNATPGTAAPTPLRAALGGSTLRVVFTQELDAASTPAGSAFKVHLTDRDHDRRTVRGTGTARVSGRAVTVTLADAVRTDELGRAEYAKPATGALRGAGTGKPEVKSWERGAFLVERVVDIGDPEAVSAAVSAVSATDSRLVVYFDEALDETSIPVVGDFSVELTSGTASTVSQVEVANQAVMLTVTGVYNTANQASVSYTRGTTAILDLAGNAASAFSVNAEGFAQGKPALQSATADGVRLVLAFDKYLRPSAVPPASAFSFHHPLQTGQTDRDEYPRSILAIGIEGKNMVLHLNAPVTPCATFEVSYDKTDTPRIQALDGQQPDAFTHQTVINARAGSCVRRAVGGAGGQAGGGGPVWEGKSVTLGFQQALDTRRALDASAFATAAGCGSSGASAPKVQGASYTSGGAGVELTLDREAAGSETVTVCYAAAHSATGLWERDGKQVAGFAVEVTGAAAQAEPPTVTAVAVVSDAGSDATYALGETLRVRLTFSEAVDVDTSGGAPQLSIDMDPAHWGTKQAAYEGGSGSAQLTFAHTVVEPNESTQGVAVLADTLALNGGTIRSAAGTDAALSHEGLGHDPAHKVDWRLAPGTSEQPVVQPQAAASVTGVSVVSDPGGDGIYELGDRILVRLAFDQAVTVAGTPRLTIDMDPAHWGAKRALYAGGSGTAALTFAYDVVWPNESTRGIAVLADTLELNGGAVRSAASDTDADLTHAGLGHDPAHKVDWRPVLSVADAEGREGSGAAVEFAVTLSRTAQHAVTVDYATSDGTATAGEDYAATASTLTFAPGEREKTVRVPILDDAVDEGRETFTLTLSNPDGARLGGAPNVQETVRRLAPDRSLWDEADAPDPAAHSTNFRDLLLGSSFHLVSNDDKEAPGPRLSAWGRVATSGFDGREDELSLSGTVTTATLGVDGAWDRWLTGLLLAYSEGDGSFSHLDMPGGDVDSSLTGVHPYVAYTLSDRVRLWGMVGYGSGALRLQHEGQGATDTDLTMTMGALGARGSLLDPAHASGFALALRSDALWIVMDSAAADNLAATEAEVSRLRLVLEGSMPVALASGGSFTPSLELGLRRDGGDAETGTGVEVGGSLRYASPWGLSVEASVRALLAHEAADYREWGASGALRFDPGRQGKGLTAAITPTWGTAASGMSRLWDPSGAQALAAGDAFVPAPAGRLDAELGYGLVTLHGRGLLTPYARVALVESADQAWHLGTRLALRESLNLSLEAGRRARQGETAAHELALRANLGW